MRTLSKIQSWMMAVLTATALCGGCAGSAKEDQARVDSLFDSYHNASTAFDLGDAQNLLQYADSCGSHYGKTLAHLDMASIHTINSNHAEALRHLELVEIEPDDPPFALAYSDFVHGLSHQYNRDYNKALFYYKRAAEGFERIGRTQALATTYTNMSEIYAQCAAWEMHDHYSGMAQELFADSTIVGYNIMSDSIYTLIHKGRLEEAYAAWKRHHKAFEGESADGLQFAYIYNHYDQALTLHYQMGDYDSAAYYNAILAQLVADNPSPTIHADLALSQAQILLRQGAARESLERCHELLEAGERGSIPTSTMLEVYPTLLECYNELGMWQMTSRSAIEYSDRLKNYSLQLESNNLLQEQIEQRYEQLLEQSKQERQRLNSRLMLVAIATLVIVLALMGVVIYKQRRQRIEQELRLKSEQELDTAQHQLAESEMRQAMIQEQIVTYTEQMRELATDMPKRLKAKTFLNLDQIQRQRDSDAWTTFEKSFEKEHGDFSRRLTEQHPQVNATDIKICMLMRTGMGSKDIANMLHITPETLRTFRYNLRKKLGLQEQGVSLEEFVGRV